MFKDVSLKLYQRLIFLKVIPIFSMTEAYETYTLKLHILPVIRKLPGWNTHKPPPNITGYLVNTFAK